MSKITFSIYFDKCFLISNDKGKYDYIFSNDFDLRLRFWTAEAALDFIEKERYNFPMSAESVVVAIRE